MEGQLYTPPAPPSTGFYTRRHLLRPWLKKNNSERFNLGMISYLCLRTIPRGLTGMIFKKGFWWNLFLHGLGQRDVLSWHGVNLHFSLCTKTLIFLHPAIKSKKVDGAPQQRAKTNAIHNGLSWVVVCLLLISDKTSHNSGQSCRINLKRFLNTIPIDSGSPFFFFVCFHVFEKQCQ